MTSTKPINSGMAPMPATLNASASATAITLGIWL